MEVTAEQVDTYNKTAIDLKDVDTLEEAKDFTYSRTVIDNKDANTLQEAKDYTYSKVEIDNKDTNTLTEAKEYTDILGIVVEQNKQDIEDGTMVVKKAEQDQLGNVINTTYETKTDANLVRGRVTLLENANMVKSVSYEPLTHKITFTFYDNTTQLLDLPLESAIVGASYDNANQRHHVHIAKRLNAYSAVR